MNVYVQSPYNIQTYIILKHVWRNKYKGLEFRGQYFKQPYLSPIDQRDILLESKCKVEDKINENYVYC